MRQLPEGYSIPIVPPLILWQLYVCGHPSENIPPLRIVAPFDFSILKERKKLTDVRFLMKRLQNESMKKGLWISPMTIEQAAMMIFRNDKEQFRCCP